MLPAHSILLAGKQLGSGTFSSVFIAREKKTGYVVGARAYSYANILTNFSIENRTEEDAKEVSRRAKSTQ